MSEIKNNIFNYFCLLMLSSFLLQFLLLPT